jgi:DNA mismatch repair protein MSH6
MGPLDGAVSSARRSLAGTSDLERCLARLAASVGGAAAGDGGGYGRDAAHVVLYEDVAKRRVKVLVGAMKDLQGLRAALEAFQEVRGWGWGWGWGVGGWQGVGGWRGGACGVC